MINNRQAGRRRGRNNNGGGGNGPRQGGGGGRGDNGNRIDSRARGNAAQLLEKYKNLASDAQRQGDRVNTEYYLQFADHYFRVLADQKGRFEDPQPRRSQNDFDGEGDDYGDEGEPIRAGEQGELRGERQPDRPQRDGEYRNDRQPREQMSQRDGGDYRNDRQPREQAQRDGDDYRADRQPREQNERAERQPREQNDRGQRDGGEPRAERQPRLERPRRWERDDRPRADEGEFVAEVAGQHRADPPVAGEDLEKRAEAVIEADAPLADPAPRRRGRPRREPVVEAEATGVDVDRLPPALGIAAANDADEEASKPRRRRVRAATTEA